MSYRLRNNIIRNPAGKIKFRQFKPDGYQHYHVGVWLEGDDERALDRVESVEYTLHPTFAQPVRKSSNRSNDFSVTFWSWGTFTVHARVNLVGGGAVEVAHDLDYDLPEDPTLYEQVS